MAGDRPQQMVQETKKAAKPRKQLPLPVPVLKNRSLENDIPEIPRFIRASIGEKNWRMFQADLKTLLREHKITSREIGEYLGAVGPQIRKAVEVAQARHGGESKTLFHVATAIFVAGYVHGIDPLLLMAVADSETRFQPSNRTTAMGYMQVAAASALSELSPNNRHRKQAEKKLRASLKEFGGAEFIGLREPPAVTLAKGKWPKVGKEDTLRLMTHALYNAVWAARTMLLKYGTGKNVERDSENRFAWDKKNEVAIKRLLERYNGNLKKMKRADGQIQTRAEVFSRNAYFVYQNSYKPIEDEARVGILLTRPRLTKF